MKYIEDALLRVAGQIRYLPRAMPDGHGGYWPEYKADYEEARQGGVELDRDLIDQVLGWFVEAPLSVRQRKVLWARVGKGQLVGWRRVGKKVGVSHEWARNEYFAGVEVLHNYLKSKG